MCHVSDALVGGRDGGSFASHDGEVGPVAVDEFEGRVLCAGGKSRVDREFSGGQVISPVVLALVAEDVKVLFDFLIHTFSLTIALWVVSRGETGFNAEVLIQDSHEMCCKLQAAIGVHLSRDAVESENILVVKVSNAFS